MFGFLVDCTVEATPKCKDQLWPPCTGSDDTVKLRPVQVCSTSVQTGQQGALDANTGVFCFI